VYVQAPEARQACKQHHSALCQLVKARFVPQIVFLGLREPAYIKSAVRSFLALVLNAFKSQHVHPAIISTDLASTLQH